MMEKDSKKNSSFALQRVPIKAKLTNRLNLNGIRKTLAGVMATVTLFSLCSCGQISKEIGNNETGYYYEDNADILGVIENTSSYYLVNLDGKIYVVKDLKPTITLSGISVHRYYDILCSGKKSNCIGVNLELDGSDTLQDYNFLGGEYGLNKLLPVGSYVPLSKFVTSKKPSKEDLAFWTSNTCEVHKLFEEMIMGDVSKEWSNGSDTKYTINYPLKSFKCSQKDGETTTLVGYRTSNSEKDNGYNYVYNIFDGDIYYIGKNREDSFASIEENSVESGKTISELRSIYGVEFAYDNTDQTVNPLTSSEPVISEKPVISEIPIVSEDPVQESEPIDNGGLNSNLEENAKKIESYKDIFVIDVSSITFSTESNFEEKGIKYLFVYRANGTIFYPFYEEDLYSYATIATDFSSFSYYNYSEENYVESFTPADCSSNICSLDDFLKSHGLDQYIKESYTYGDIGQIERLVNSKKESKVKASEVIVTDLGEDAPYARYVLFRKVGESYYNISKSAFFSPSTSGKGYYNRLIDIYDQYCYESHHTMSLEEFMDECIGDSNNLWNELISWQDEYTDTDLAIIEDILNGHNNLELGRDFAKQIEGKKLTFKKND